MLMMRDVVVDVAATLGSTYYVVGVRDRYKYANGLRTEITDGANIDVVLRDRGYQRVTVAVPRETVKLTPEEIVANVQVAFQNLTVKVFVIDGKPRVSVKADSVSAVPAKRAAA